MPFDAFSPPFQMTDQDQVVNVKPSKRARVDEKAVGKCVAEGERVDSILQPGEVVDGVLVVKGSRQLVRIHVCLSICISRMRLWLRAVCGFNGRSMRGTGHARGTCVLCEGVAMFCWRVQVATDCRHAS